MECTFKDGAIGERKKTHTQNTKTNKKGGRAERGNGGKRERWKGGTALFVSGHNAFELFQTAQMRAMELVELANANPQLRAVLLSDDSAECNIFYST